MKVQNCCLCDNELLSHRITINGKIYCEECYVKNKAKLDAEIEVLPEDEAFVEQMNYVDKMEHIDHMFNPDGVR